MKGDDTSCTCSPGMRARSCPMHGQWESDGRGGFARLVGIKAGDTVTIETPRLVDNGETVLEHQERAIAAERKAGRLVDHGIGGDKWTMDKAGQLVVVEPFVHEHCHEGKVYAFAMSPGDTVNTLLGHVKALSEGMIMLGPPDPPQPPMYKIHDDRVRADKAKGRDLERIAETLGVRQPCSSLSYPLRGGTMVVRIPHSVHRFDETFRRVQREMDKVFVNMGYAAVAPGVDHEAIPLCECRGAPGVGAENCRIHNAFLESAARDSHLPAILETRIRNPPDVPDVPHVTSLACQGAIPGEKPELNFRLGRHTIKVVFPDGIDAASVNYIYKILLHGDWWKARQDELLSTIDNVIEERDEAQAALSKLDVALPSLQTELQEFARRFDKGEVLSECITCGVCQTNYIGGDGHFGACPKCYPGVVTYTQMLTNPSFWPGHKFTWSERRGPRGRWVLHEDNFTVKREDLQMLTELLPPKSDAHELLFPAFANEMKRLQGIAREVAAPLAARAEAESKRAIDLGDKCGDLEKRLDQKRIECDKLRDEIARLSR